MGFLEKINGRGKTRLIKNKEQRPDILNLGNQQQNWGEKNRGKVIGGRQMGERVKREKLVRRFLLRFI